jgi:hypothetical protein
MLYIIKVSYKRAYARLYDTFIMVKKHTLMTLLYGFKVLRGNKLSLRALFY